MAKQAVTADKPTVKEALYAFEQRVERFTRFATGGRASTAISGTIIVEGSISGRATSEKDRAVQSCSQPKKR